MDQARRRGNEGTACVAASDSQRAAAFSQQLRQAHQQLRSQLARLRGELGREEDADTDLQVHCLAFCSALATHHAGEDNGMFTDVIDARPDLAPAIAKLIDDHAAIAVILLQVRALATRGKTIAAEGLPMLQRELDGPPRSWSRISDTKNVPSAPLSTTACRTPDGRGRCSGQPAHSNRCHETVLGNRPRRGEG